MKKFSLISLVLLALLPVAESCRKSSARGELIHFSAAARKSAETKTVYGDLVENGARQQINWSDNDQVDIYSSDTGVAATEGGEAYAVYTLDVNASDPTTATLTQPDGLLWNETGNVTFYGVYPAGTPLSTLRDDTPAPGRFSMSIDWDQDPGLDAGNLPSEYGYMVSKTYFTQGSNNVTMTFSPVFTTFEIHLKNQQSTSLTLQSFAIKSDTDYLTGTFETDWTGRNRVFHIDPAARYQLAQYDFPANTTISDEDEVSFNLFLFPMDLSNLYLEVTYTNGAGQTIIRKLPLTQGDNSSSYITFEGGRKHVITGLALDSSEFWTLDVDGTVLQWDGVDQTIEEEVSISQKVQITGAIETTDKWKEEFEQPKSNHYADSQWKEAGDSGYGTGANNYDKNYQIRTLNRDLPSADRYFTLTFRPSAPTGGYWQLIPQYKEGDAESPRHFRFERDTPSGTTDSLTGQILNQTETIRIYPVNWDPSDLNTYNVWFTCLFSTSPSFSHSINADSEFQDVHSDGNFSYWVFRLQQYNGSYVDSND